MSHAHLYQNKPFPQRYQSHVDISTRSVNQVISLSHYPSRTRELTRKIPHRRNSTSTTTRRTRAFRRTQAGSFRQSAKQNTMDSFRTQTRSSKATSATQGRRNPNSCTTIHMLIHSTSTPFSRKNRTITASEWRTSSKTKGLITKSISEINCNKDTRRLSSTVNSNRTTLSNSNIILKSNNECLIVLFKSVKFLNN